MKQFLLSIILVLMAGPLSGADVKGTAPPGRDDLMKRNYYA